MYGIVTDKMTVKVKFIYGFRDSVAVKVALATCIIIGGDIHVGTAARVSTVIGGTFQSPINVSRRERFINKHQS